jgi:hypothetical protein
MPPVVIEKPILNSPFEEPTRCVTFETIGADSDRSFAPPETGNDAATV